MIPPTSLAPSSPRIASTSVPIVSMRVTPACRARAIISARSPSNSGKCRCAWVSKSSRLTSSSRVRGSRRDSETHTADELARRRHHVHRPSPLRIGGKADLTRERPVALAPATLDRRETDDVDDLALEPPDVVHGLLESRRRVDRGVGDEPVPEHRLGGDRRRQLERTRSEEHTSELQSQSNIVCRLLLEKKKIQIHLQRVERKFALLSSDGEVHAVEERPLTRQQYASCTATTLVMTPADARVEH